ncbi:ABC transporter substrate-binding protein [Nonomuraea sp. NPDC059194]|uniref:ABC transporter substrate-binding protein n=1 Tax=Nonomuraea sp. NPDC059194 TaxID=3346764 RepID=UPI003698B2DC
MRRKALTTAAAGLTLAMALAACAGSPTQTPGQGQTAPAATGAAGAAEAADAAVGKIFNPSDKKGGTLKMANTADWDSLDPGNTYYGYSLNFARLYGRALLMFKSAPGADGNTLVPDLAESLGKSSDDAKTWTYKLRSGIKFEDGTPVTSKDVAYSVARQFDKEIHPNGPTYLNALLDWPKDYKGAYKSKDADFSSAVETPDDQTIVFHLKEPFGLFDYIMQMPMTMPVPKDKDTGTKYQEHVVSTGPYKFEKNEIGKGFTLVRNDQWDPASDPNRPALPDKIEVQTGVNADDLDNRLISGDVQVAVDGLGIGNAALPKVLPDPALKARTDNPVQQRTWYTSIIPDVAPLDNVDCRRAIAFAADRSSLFRAYGGETGGILASAMIPSSLAGHKEIDLYKSPDDKGDVEKAKAALAKCGQPNGFETNISYRTERTKEKAAAESLQQSLARVGIKVTLKPYPQDDYFALYAGKPSYVKENKIGLAINGWGSDYPDTYGFMQAIMDSRDIRDAGNYNLSVKIPEVDKMIDQIKAEPDAAKRADLWSQIDHMVIDQAVVMPSVYGKALYLRGKNLTNVFISDSQQMYDYVGLGVQQ